MTNSSFNQPPDKEQESLRATGYNNNKEVKGKYHIYPEMAAAGLWTNTPDLAKYVIETQLSIAGKSNKVLSKEMSIKRLDNQFGVLTNDFKNVKYFRHSGGNDGFLCFYIGSFEDGNGVAIMTNGRSVKLIEEIVNSIASLNNWKNYPLEPQKESISLAIKNECRKNIDKGIELYKNLKKNKGNEYNFSNENELNNLGYEFLKDENTDAAIKIFSLNVNEFPNTANVYDSRGEAYFNKKEYMLSRTDYQKVLQLDPANQNAKEMLLKIDKLLQKQ